MFQQTDDFEEHLAIRFGSRSGVFADLKLTQTMFRKFASAEQLDGWLRKNVELYEANVGPEVLTALWALHRTIVRASGAVDIQPTTNAIFSICLSAGAHHTMTAIRTAETFLGNGSYLNHVPYLLEGIVILADKAPESIPDFSKQSKNLFARIDSENVIRWIMDGVNLYPNSMQKRREYFSLNDPKSLSQLVHYEGRGQYSEHEAQLKYLVRSLWQMDINVQRDTTETADPSLERLKIRGNVLLVPTKVPRRHKDNQAAYFEAAILHATAHIRFTKNRFPTRGMKPMQIALTALIEDARVERLAAQQYPGLANMWLGFHTVEPSGSGPVARTISSLFSTLARALSDAEFQCSDTWITKGRNLFNIAFDQAPDDQFLAERIARLLGNDLGQMRIPFDPKSYTVEPDYRDDGLGLFEFDEAENLEQPPSEILIDAARIERAEDEESSTQDEEEEQVDGSEKARSKQANQDDELGAVLGLFPEWDNKLQRDQLEFVTVREKIIVPQPSPNWLSEKLSHYVGTGAQIQALSKHAQFGRHEVAGRAFEGDSIDIDAATDMVIAMHQGQSPDPRVYVRQRRAKKDVTLGILIDTSKSTGDIPNGGQESILQMAVISTALLVEGLKAAGDNCGVFAFSSNGKDDVQMASIKAFGEADAPVQERLAALNPGLSTRLGSALRFVSSQLQEQKTRRKVLIVLTDGEPSDIDMEGSEDLMEDARRAIAVARSKGLDLFCIPMGKAAYASSATIFGKKNTFPIERIEELPSRLSALYFKVTG